MVPVDVTDRQQRPSVKCHRCGSTGGLHLDRSLMDFVCSDPVGCAARIVAGARGSPDDASNVVEGSTTCMRTGTNLPIRIL